MTINDDLNACAALVERADPDRFAATMAAPVSAREVLFPLYAFNTEIARAPWVTQEPMIAEMRLQWWRDALDEIALGRTVRRHEVVTPLAMKLDAQDVEYLDQLIAARRWDIAKDAFEDAAHFEEYIQSTSGNLMLVAARKLGGYDENTIRDFAYASGLANWFRAIPALVSHKRIPLVDGRPDAVRLLAEQGLQRLARARQNHVAVSRGARAALLAGWQTEAILKQVVAMPERVQDGSLGTSDFRRRMSLAWRVIRGRF